MYDFYGIMCVCVCVSVFLFHSIFMASGGAGGQSPPPFSLCYDSTEIYDLYDIMCVCLGKCVSFSCYVYGPGGAGGQSPGAGGRAPRLPISVVMITLKCMTSMVLCVCVFV